MAQAQSMTDTLRAMSDSAVQHMEYVLAQPPQERLETVDDCERCVVEMRDYLIDHLRQNGEALDAPRWRELLNQVNGALSLIVGVEYPAAGIQQEELEQARDVLKDVRQSVNVA